MPATIKTKSDSASAKPVSEVRVSGVRLPIWRNEGTDGPHFKAGLPEFSYRTQEGEWLPMTGLSLRDCVNAIKALSLAHTEILKAYRDAKLEAAPATEEDA